MITHSCLFCENSNHKTVSRFSHHNQGIQVLLCMGCGLISVNPVPSYDELESYYFRDRRKDNLGPYEPPKRRIWRNFKTASDFLNKNQKMLTDRKSWLDIGAGTGEFTYLAQAKKIDCVGVDINKDYTTYCQDYLNLDLTNMTLEECDFSEGQFDFIYAANIIERTHDPIAALKKLRSWLSKDGVIYIQTRDVEKDAQNRLRGRLFNYGENYYFTPFTLRLLANQAGLIEKPDNNAQSKNTTSCFFQKGEESGATPSQMLEHAVCMSKVMELRKKRFFPTPSDTPAAERFINSTTKRIEELQKIRKFETHHDVAKYFAAQISKAEL